MMHRYRNESYLFYRKALCSKKKSFSDCRYVLQPSKKVNLLDSLQPVVRFTYSRFSYRFFVAGLNLLLSDKRVAINQATQFRNLWTNRGSCFMEEV